MMGNNFGSSTGYAPNPEIQIMNLLRDIVTKILHDLIQAGRCVPEIASEVYERFEKNIGLVCQDVASKFIDHNNQCNTDLVRDYLLNGDLGRTISSVERDFANARYSNMSNSWNNSTRFGNNYNGYNNNNYSSFGNHSFGNNNAYGYNQNNNYNSYNSYNYTNNNSFGTMNSNNTMSNSHGFAKMKSQAPISNNIPISNNTNMVNTTNSLSNTFANVTPGFENRVVIKNELYEIIGKSIKDRKERRKNKISIDKITNDTSSLIDNADYISNKISESDIEILRNENAAINTKDIKFVDEVIIDNPDYCVTHNLTDMTHGGNVVNISNFELKVPVVNAQEAIELVKEASPSLTTHEQWVSTINYKELVTKKIIGFGEEAKAAFRLINSNLTKVEDLTTVNNYIIPIIKRQITEVRQYIESLVFDRINELFRTILYIPDHPNIYPTIDDWVGIYKLVDEDSKDSNEYIRYMFSKDAETYKDKVYLCVKSALIDIFDDEDDSNGTVVEAEGNNLGLIAKLSEVTCISGVYRMCDYGNIEGTSHMEQLIKKFNRDYIVHKFDQSIMVTNFDMSKVIGTKAIDTVIEVVDSLQQYAIYSIIELLRKCGINRDMILIEMDSTGSYINRTYRVNLGIDNSLFISRQ